MFVRLDNVGTLTALSIILLFKLNANLVNKTFFIYNLVMNKIMTTAINDNDDDG